MASRILGRAALELKREREREAYWARLKRENDADVSGRSNMTGYAVRYWYNKQMYDDGKCGESYHLYTIKRLNKFIEELQKDGYYAYQVGQITRDALEGDIKWSNCKFYFQQTEQIEYCHIVEGNKYEIMVEDGKCIVTWLTFDDDLGWIWRGTISLDELTEHSTIDGREIDKDHVQTIVDIVEALCEV